MFGILFTILNMDSLFVDLHYVLASQVYGNHEEFSSSRCITFSFSDSFTFFLISDFLGNHSLNDYFLLTERQELHVIPINLD